MSRNVTTRRLFIYDDFVINTDDANSLLAHNWLTDNIVNFAVAYLADQIFDQNKEKHISIVYATQCELLKYQDGNDAIEMLLREMGVSRQRWALFIYNDSNRPDQIYSGTHWSLIVFNPNQHFLLYVDPSPGASASPKIQQFASNLSHYLELDSQNAICNCKQNPHMQISGDCGMFVIEYARIIMQAIVSFGMETGPENFDFFASPYHLRDGTSGIIRARIEWQKIVEKLSRDHQPSHTLTNDY